MVNVGWMSSVIFVMAPSAPSPTTAARKLSPSFWRDKMGNSRWFADNAEYAADQKHG